MAKYTTVSITEENSKKLKKYCADLGISQADFVPLALEYFNKWGIDPKTHATPAQEITKMHKRIEHIFGFLKKHETDFIMPIAEHIASSNNDMKESFVDLHNTIEQKNREMVLLQQNQISNLKGVIVEDIEKNRTMISSVNGNAVATKNNTNILKKGLQKFANQSLKSLVNDKRINLYKD